MSKPLIIAAIAAAVSALAAAPGYAMELNDLRGEQGYYQPRPDYRPLRRPDFRFRLGPQPRCRYLRKPSGHVIMVCP